MTNDVTDPLPRWCRITFVIAALAVLSIALRRADLLTNKPLTEDGYYMLAVSRHIALGDGISVDGVQPTNGVQPLFTFLAAPAYWLAGGDRMLALRWVLLLHGLYFVAAAWLFGLVLRDLVSRHVAARGVARTEALRWIGSCSWLASGYLFLMSHNGLETGGLLLLYLAYWRFAQLHPLRGLPLAAAHGAWLGVIVLARIDATFFVTALCVWHVLRGEGPFAARLREAVIAGAIAVAVSSPWWIYNVAEFGALMPSSGAAQSGMVDPGDGVVMSRITEGLRNLLLVATPILYAGDGAGSSAFVLVRLAFLAAIAGILWWRRGNGAAATPGAATSGTGQTVAAALLLTGAAFAVYYPVNFWATHFYSRYFIVLAPFGMAVFAIAVLLVFHKPRGTDVLVPLALLACTAGLAVIVHTGKGFAGNQWLRDQVMLVRENVPPGARIAAGQSGTLGYFVDGVHNLDGKVNAAALRHQADMNVYLTEHRIEWLCDWPAYLHRYVDPQQLAAEWQLIATRGEFELWRRR